MNYIWEYSTPNGFDDMLMASDGESLTCLCFGKSKDIYKLPTDCTKKLLPIFQQTIDWLDCYFSGNIPTFSPNYKLLNATPFRKQVSDIMQKIPYGTTTSYKSIADKIAMQKGINKMSAQAVGGAVGWNPICIIVPCHRVLGSNGSITGYGGGTKNKIALLKLEGIRI